MEKIEDKIVFFDRLPDGGRPDTVIDKPKKGKPKSVRNMEKEETQKPQIIFIDRLRRENE